MIDGSLLVAMAVVMIDGSLLVAITVFMVMAAFWWQRQWSW